MKIIIAGSRTFSDYGLLERTMTEFVRDIQQPIQIVSGTAEGADKLGEQFAETYGYEIKRFPADWKSHGKRAGVMRNESMARYADACIVFWDGESRGSKNMIEAAKKCELNLWIVNFQQ